ncbi:tetratricopeptide repeat-containing sensor histidine kinase [Flaviaesturariibacter amylovorans]|uniref:histidine kinase n=1 Tax=Flaviaesturariibacter amylovorans TaxID=1084520 RepID=A0ABP8GFD5_9BACT
MFRPASWTFLLLFLFLLAGCRQRECLPEKEEVVYWDSRVLRPTYQTIERTRSLDSGLRVYDSLLARDPGPRTPFIRAQRSAVFGYYYYFINPNTVATARHVDTFLSYFNTRELQACYPRAYMGNMLHGGELAFQMRLYDKANEYYFRARSTAYAYLEPCERSGFFYRLGMVLYRQKSYSLSARNFLEAYRSQDLCPNQSAAIGLQQQEIQSNIGLCYVHLKRPDSALFHFRNALDVANRFRDSLGPVGMDMIHGVVYGNMAKVYVGRGQLDSAEHLFRKSLALNNRKGYEVRDAQLVALQLAEVYDRQQRYAAMRPLLDSVRIALDTIRDIEGEEAWLRLQYIYYRDTKQPLLELPTFKRYVALRDSLATHQKELEQADITRQLRDKDQDLQIRLLRKNNQLAQIYLWVSVLLALMAVVIILLIWNNYRRSKRNIAALRALNERVSQQKEELEAANREKDRILHVVAHDLRNPIGVTTYLADQMLLEEQTSENEGPLRMIKEASGMALALTNELLGLQSDAAPIERRRTELNALVRAAVTLMHPKALEKGQTIRMFAPEEPLYLLGWPDRLQRVVVNLLSNALKFSPAGSSVEIQVTRVDTAAWIAVRDEGIGIPEELRGVLFAPFSAARRTGTGGERSVGLGLSICREIVEAHGGSIIVESGTGVGTTFVVRLPLNTG